MAAKATGPLATLNEEQTVQLIELINSHSELWDSRRPKYRNKHIKSGMWTSLQLSFVASTNIQCTVEQLQAKFASLRNIFSRELRKKKQAKISGAGTDDLYQSTWPYFDHLQFLLPVMSITKPTITNLGTPVAPGGMGTDEDKNECLAEENQETSSEGVGNISIEWADATAETEISEQNCVKSIKKRKQNNSDELTDCVLQYFHKRNKENTAHVMEMNNPDHVWAMHLVHTISKISNEAQKELLKIEMLDMASKCLREDLRSQTTSNI